MHVEFLTKELEPAYSDFLLQSETTMVSMSLGYRDLLKELLDARDHYLIAVDNGKVIGALPLLVKENEEYGRVYNSLPFYGSNGGIITDHADVGVSLLQHYLVLLNEPGSAAGTLITSPFECNNHFYESAISGALRDYRIGQFTVLPDAISELMPMFHHKTRNAIRKGEKSDITVHWADVEKYVDFLIETHTLNSEGIGVPAKPKKFFDLLSKYFRYGPDYRIYTASINGEPIASLLTLYFNKTAEYYTPATVNKYREMQPMSVLVYRAMCDAVNNGFRVWNWGGTPARAEGVYNFKKRWGTRDREYYYFTTLLNEGLKDATPTELRAAFPNFFVLPFSELATAKAP